MSNKKRQYPEVRCLRNPTPESTSPPTRPSRSANRDANT